MIEPVTYDGDEATYPEWRSAVMEKHPGKAAIVPARFTRAPMPPDELAALAGAAAGRRFSFLVRHEALPVIEERP